MPGWMEKTIFSDLFERPLVSRKRESSSEGSLCAGCVGCARAVLLSFNAVWQPRGGRPGFGICHFQKGGPGRLPDFVRQCRSLPPRAARCSCAVLQFPQLHSLQLWGTGMGPVRIALTRRLARHGMRVRCEPTALHVPSLGIQAGRRALYFLSFFCSVCMYRTRPRRGACLLRATHYCTMSIFTVVFVTD